MPETKTKYCENAQWVCIVASLNRVVRKAAFCADGARIIRHATITFRVLILLSTDIFLHREQKNRILNGGGEGRRNPYLAYVRISFMSTRVWENKRRGNGNVTFPLSFSELQFKVNWFHRETSVKMTKKLYSLFVSCTEAVRNFSAPQLIRTRVRRGSILADPIQSNP